jgi:hypothetical protein
MARRTCVAAQASPAAATDVLALSELTSFYKRREDVERLRSELEDSVPDFQEYRAVLARFIHGQCLRSEFEEMVQSQLTTDELRALHNEFLRAILHNAHFSMAPPPNVPAPRRPPPRVPRPVAVAPPRRPPSVFSSCTAGDLRHLHSVDELARRVEFLVKLKGIEFVEATAVRILFKAIKAALGRLLLHGWQLQPRGLAASDRPQLTFQPMMLAVGSSGLAWVMSPMVVTKYSMVREK